MARVTENTRTACAIRDSIDFGLVVGGQVPIDTTLCLEMKHLNAPIAIDDASSDPAYRDHRTPKMYDFRSYVSAPIILDGGRYFGSLFAFDPEPADVNNPKVIRTFTRFAGIIAMALRNQESRNRDLEKLSDERATSELREQFIAILGHDLRNPLQAIFAGSDMLLRKPNDPARVLQSAERIQSGARRMSSLIDDVLDFARGKLGGGIGIAVDGADGVTAGLEQIVRVSRCPPRPPDCVGHPRNPKSALRPRPSTTDRVQPDRQRAHARRPRQTGQGHGADRERPLHTRSLE